MSMNIITVDSLGKQYHIGSRKDPKYRTLRDSLSQSLTAPIRRTRKLLSGQATGAAELDETIWALEDISFTVDRGEVVGFIGANGAGKSTLLKILSRITEPTTGWAEISGRVGCLLEVGTGFHPELTGRENVYLNGAILGMTRHEIERKFDEIVDFSEIEKFLDTPVKHYSSGMSLRLAFAVAAHLEPEILIVDEVLAVGDASFQAKCLGKMGDVAKHGRTVLLVSHNMGAITQLCGRAMLLEHGRIVKEGRPDEVVARYLTASSAAEGAWMRPDDYQEDEAPDVLIRSVRTIGKSGEPVSVVPFSSGFNIEIEYDIVEPIRDLVVLCAAFSHQGPVWQSWDIDTTDWNGRLRPSGRYTSICYVPPRLLRPGRYDFNVCSHVPGARLIELLSRVISVDVSEVGFDFRASRDGVITPLLRWDVLREEESAATSPR